MAESAGKNLISTWQVARDRRTLARDCSSEGVLEVVPLHGSDSIRVKVGPDCEWLADCARWTRHGHSPLSSRPWLNPNYRLGVEHRQVAPLTCFDIHNVSEETPVDEGRGVIGDTYRNLEE